MDNRKVYIIKDILNYQILSMNNNAAVKDNIKLLNKIYEIDNIEEPMKLIDIILKYINNDR